MVGLLCLLFHMQVFSFFFLCVFYVIYGFFHLFSFPFMSYVCPLHRYFFGLLVFLCLMCHYVIISIFFFIFYSISPSVFFVIVSLQANLFLVFLSLRHYRIFFCFLVLCFSFLHVLRVIASIFLSVFFFVSSMSLHAFFFVGQVVKSWCKHSIMSHTHPLRSLFFKNTFGISF